MSGRFSMYGAKQVRDHWHRAIATSIRDKYATATEIRAVLTPDQVTWLRARGLAASLDYSQAWLQRMLKKPLPLPR